LPALFLFLALQGPVFVAELWPGEGIPVVVAGRETLPLRGTPRSSDPITRQYPVRRGDTLAFDLVRFATLKPGRLVALAPAQIVGRDLDTLTYLSRADYYGDRFSRGHWAVPLGAEVEYLQYRAEGTCFVRFAGRVIDAAHCPVADTTFRPLGEPEVELWIRLVADQGPVGWLQVIEPQARVIGRRF
jgi:hypothetical protein